MSREKLKPVNCLLIRDHVLGNQLISTKRSDFSIHKIIIFKITSTQGRAKPTKKSSNLKNLAHIPPPSR